VALGDSSGYNYASGRLDWQTYYKSLSVERGDIETICLNRKIFRAWYREAILVSDLTGKMPFGWRNLPTLPHQWFWDGRAHQDPSREAAARDMNLKNHSTNLATEYAGQGKDWEVELEQVAKELQKIIQLCEKYTIPIEYMLNLAMKKVNAGV
jgi:hypothetical protein